MQARAKWWSCPFADGHLPLEPEELPRMKLTLHHINLCTGNVPAMDTFYREVLDMAPTPQMSDSRNLNQGGYVGKVSFVGDGHMQMHLSERDLGVGFRAGQAINPLERGHIAFRTDDIDTFKKRLEEKGVPYSNYGAWAMNGWEQIFFHDPDGNIIEVHQIRE
jgi:glyoxylase I family protein